MPALLILMASSAPGRPAIAALISGSYQLDYNQDVTKKGDEKKDVKKLKNTLEVRFKGFLSPVVTNEATFKVEQETNSDAADTTRLLPTLDLAFKGSYWDVKAGVKRTHENSDDPEENPKTTDNWFIEFFYLAPRAIPDFKAKYTLDTDFEEGTTDTRTQGIALSSVYKPTEWFEAKVDYSRDTMDDKLNPDTDTESERTNGSVGIRRLISSKIKLDAEYTIERTREATLLEAGGSKNSKEDQTHKLKSKLTFKPFRDTLMTGSYDYEIKQNLVLGEHTLTTNVKTRLEQAIGRGLNVSGEILRDVVESRHTVDDNTKTDDTWSVDANAHFSDLLTFMLRRQEKHTVEVHDDTTKNLTTSTTNTSATWTGVLTQFWRASASYDLIDTYGWDVVEKAEKKTLAEKKYSLKSTLDFKAVNLTLDPSYEIALKNDLIENESTETRDFKFKLAWKALSTRSIEARVDHTYGRKEDTEARNIKRTDDTNGNVSWKDPVPGALVAFDVTRSANDTSGDDIAPEITSTFGVKLDYKYQWLTMNTSFKYDKKSLTDDSETLDAKVGWLAPRWEVSLVYSFTKVLSPVLDEKFTITLLFKYNL